MSDRDKSVKAFPQLRQDRRYRCAECGELDLPRNHDGAWIGDLNNKKDMRPICGYCED